MINEFKLFLELEDGSGFLLENGFYFLLNEILIINTALYKLYFITTLTPSLNFEIVVI